MIDSHPDPITISDLRVTTPWPDLSEYVTKKLENLDAMDDHDHGHVPWLLLMLYYLEQWKKDHDGKVPTNYDQKKEFQKYLTLHQRTSSAAGPEENFDQAIGAVLKSLNNTTAPYAVRQIWDAPECENLQTDDPNLDFWILSKAIKAFYKKTEGLPLSGTLPDMKAQSADYVELQKIYKRKAQQDFTDVLTTVREIEHTLNRKSSIRDSTVETFCKNAAHMKLIRGIQDGPKVKLNQTAKQAGQWYMLFKEATLQHWVFKASHTFFASEGRFPGGKHSDENDTKKISQLAQQYMKEDLEASEADAVAEEVSSSTEEIEKLCQEL
jgi:amyloid beta precursor protein binding protein 1